ncbi:unnamed protein product [Ixodes pacificus]
MRKAIPRRHLASFTGTELAATLGANPAEAECPVGTPSATTAEAPATLAALESEKQPTVDTPPVQATVTVVATTAPATTAATSAPTVVAAVTSANLPDNCDTRIVRFNNRDLENLRKIQDELNVRKAGGGSPRAPGSPIVIKAELTNPNKVVTLQLTPTSLASGVAAGGLTKVVINPAGGGHPQLVGPVGATLQLVGTAVGQGAVAGAQPTTLLLSSPTRGSGGALMRAGQQLVRVAAPGSIGSAAKGMYVVSPMKLGGKVAMIPISVGKSPQRIAPAPSVSALIPSGATLGPTARLVFATASGATATTATATATARATVPLSSVVPAKMLVRPMVRATTLCSTARSRKLRGIDRFVPLR